MRLLCRVVDHCISPGLGGGQHHVHRRADGYHVKEDIAAGQVIAFGGQDSSDLARFRADRLESLQVLVHRAGADFASAGRRDLRFSAAAQQCAEQVIAGTETLRIVIGNRRPLRRPRIHPHHLSGFIIHLGAELLEDVGQRVNVFDIREVFNCTGFVAKQGSRNHGNRSILAAADPDLAFQGMAAGYKHPLFTQGIHLLPDLPHCSYYYTLFRCH